MIWEAQYGDFINGAQVMLDQFVTSGRAKWGLQAVARLPAAARLRGAGPGALERRPERILQAAADINLRLVNCTTAAQYFHLLRRQAALLTRDPLPLFVLTPKSLLRHPAVASAPRELEQGRFQSVIDDDEARGRAKSVKRLVLCSGKVYVDLIASERRRPRPRWRSCRVEQLYPFPGVALREVLDAYPSVARRRLAAGRAGEHGRVGVHAAAARGADRRSLSAPLHRPRAQREPVGRLGRLAPAQSEARSWSGRSISSSHASEIAQGALEAGPESDSGRSV